MDARHACSVSIHAGSDATKLYAFNPRKFTVHLKGCSSLILATVLPYFIPPVLCTYIIQARVVTNPFYHLFHHDTSETEWRMLPLLMGEKKVKLLLPAGCVGGGARSGSGGNPEVLKCACARAMCYKIAGPATNQALRAT